MSDCRPGYGYDGCQCATCRSGTKPTCMSHDKTHCPICADMDTYGPTAYPKAWDEGGKADPMGMAMYFYNELAREKRETKKLREQVKDLL